MDATPAKPGLTSNNIGAWRVLRRALKWVAFAVIAATLVIAIPAAMAGFRGGMASARHLPPVAPVDFAAILPFSAIALQLTLLWGALRGVHGDLDTGLGNQRIRHRGLMLGFAALILIWDSALIATLVALIRQGGPVPKAPAVLASIPHDVGGAVLHIALVCLIAPLAEEAFFRGWLWTALRKTRSPAWTIGVTGLLWLALHLTDGTIRALMLLPLGVILGLARHYGDSMRASLALHVLNNGFVTAVQMLPLLLAA